MTYNTYLELEYKRVIVYNFSFLLKLAFFTRYVRQVMTYFSLDKNLYRHKTIKLKFFY